MQNKLIYTALALILCASQAFAQSEIVDSLNLPGYKEASNLQKIAILNEGVLKLCGNNPRLSYELACYNLDFAFRYGYNYEKALAFNGLGKSQKTLGFFNEALNSFLTEKEYLEKTQDTARKPKSLLDIGESYRAISELVLAENYVNMSLSIYQNRNDQSGIANCYDRLAAIYFEQFFQKNFGISHDTAFINKSIEYAKNGINLAYSLNERHVLASSFNILGADYIVLNKPTLAIINLKKSIGYTTDTVDFATVYISIASHYLKNSQIDSAEYYSRAALKIAFNTEFFSSIYFSADILANCFAFRKQYDSAFYYSKLARDYQMKGYGNEKKIEAVKFETTFKIKQKNNEINEEREKRKYFYIIPLIATFFIIIIVVIILRKNKRMKSAYKQLSKTNELMDYQKSQLAELNATKDKFFSIIAHDLKNPLASFRNLTRTLVVEFESFSDGDKKELMKDMEGSAEILYELLENLLEWSRSQRGSIPFNPEEIQLSKLVDFAVQSALLSAKNKSVNIINDIDDELKIYADLNLLSTVVRNIVSNSIKFTPQNGEIFLKAFDRNDTIDIVIADTGLGMSKDKLGKLFKLGEKISSRGTNNETGSGLGLLLCKDFVDKHNGKIWVESEEGIGSTFYVSLPKMSAANNNAL